MFIIPKPSFFFDLVQFLQATKGLLLALQLEFHHMQCLLALSTPSRMAIGTVTEHILKVGREERTEFTSCNLPA
jgi:hypothetical protein